MNLEIRDRVLFTPANAALLADILPVLLWVEEEILADALPAKAAVFWKRYCAEVSYREAKWKAFLEPVAVMHGAWSQRLPNAKCWSLKVRAPRGG